MGTTHHWPSTHVSLLIGVRAPGDDNAWRRFVDLYGPPIYRFCRTRGLQHADASDVMQDVFLAVGRFIPKFDYDPSRGKFRSWLSLIIRQSIGNHCRRNADAAIKFSLDALESETDSGAMAEWEAELNRHLLNRALAAIRSEFQPEVWCAFEQVWLADVPPMDVARQLCQKPQWVYTAKFKVLQRLREELGRMAEDLAV